MPTPKEVAVGPVALVRAEEEPVPAGVEPVAVALVEGEPVAAVRVLVEAAQEVPVVVLELGPVVRVALARDRAAAEVVLVPAQVPEQEPEQEARALVAAGTPTR
jgi:hypothetical protein